MAMGDRRCWGSKGDEMWHRKEPFASCPLAGFTCRHSSSSSGPAVLVSLCLSHIFAQLHICWPTMQRGCSVHRCTAWRLGIWVLGLLLTGTGAAGLALCLRAARY